MLAVMADEHSDPGGPPADGRGQDGTGADGLGPAERALAAARGALDAARARESAYGIAAAEVRMAQALAVLGRTDEALQRLDDAGRYVDLLRADGRHDTVSWLKRASPALPPPGQDDGDLGLLEAYAGVVRAQTLAAAGRWGEASAAVEAATPLVRGWGRRDLRRALDAVRTALAQAHGDHVSALAGLDRRIRETERADPAGSLRARYERAAVLLDDGQAGEAARAALLVVRDADPERDAALVAASRQLLGAALAADGRTDEALTALRAAFDDFSRLGDTAAVLGAAPGLADGLVSAGRPAEAVDVLAAALATAEAGGSGPGGSGAGPAAALRSSLGVAYDEAGRVDEAVTTLEAAVAGAEAAGDPVAAADARHGLAVVLATRRGDDPEQAVEALSLLDAARDAYREHGHPDRAVGCDHEAAALLGRLGSYPAARSRYAAAAAGYEGLPEALRDTGSWPDEVADVAANLALLDTLAADPSGTEVPDGAFRSGGHRMRH